MTLEATGFCQGGGEFGTAIKGVRAVALSRHTTTASTFNRLADTFCLSPRRLQFSTSFLAAVR